MRAKLVADWAPPQVDAIIRSARRIWSELYGAPRTHIRLRVDVGAAREKKLCGPERAWLRKRHEAVSGSMLCRPRADGTIAVSKEGLRAQGHWTDSHEKEECFQRKKLVGLKAEAWSVGVIGDEDVGEEVMARARHEQEIAAKTARLQRNKDHRA